VMLNNIIDWIMYSLIGLNSELHWIESLNFFIYDSIKIIFMLFFMILLIGFLRTYIPQKKIRKLMSKKNYGINNLVAASLGAITPFCSCSSIPLFLGFIEAGVPLGVTFSFLITSPIVNEYLVVLMLGFFGWKITLAYVISGIFLGAIAGNILGKMKLKKYLVKDILSQKISKEKIYKTIKERINFGLNESLSILKKLWLWILVGVAIGAIIHNYVPSEFIQSIINQGGIFSVPLAVLLGVPIYGSCAAIVPIALALFEKGIPLGTALAFMMAVSALSLPQAVILRRALKLKLIAIFFVIVTISIILIGYLFNLLQNVLV
ncbi:MAG: permease, partial [Nanoarchaeota archaeon]|nr:permease [Nanoarchaeota archaeon]